MSNNNNRIPKTTSKKQKIIGIQEYINPDTQEVIPMVVTSIEDRDFNFHKMWLNNFIMSLDEITNRKMELAFWIIEHLNKENQLIMTQRDISNKTGISIKTVSETMRMLQHGKLPFLVKINSGAYQVNPNIIYKGSHNSRMGIIFDYSQSVSAKKQHDREELQMEHDEVLAELQNTELTDNERQVLQERLENIKKQML